MYARIATFESDPSQVDQAIELVRSEVESGDTPEGLEGAKMLMLVNRETGKGLGVDAVRQRGRDAPRGRGAQRDEPRRERAPHVGRLLRGAGPDRELSARAQLEGSSTAFRPSRSGAPNTTRLRVAT